MHTQRYNYRGYIISSDFVDILFRFYFVFYFVFRIIVNTQKIKKFQLS